MDIRLPNLGEGADSGVVVSILVSEGDAVAADQNVIELETGKAVAGIPAGRSGRVEKIMVKVGDKITPGTLILTLAGSDAPAAAAPVASRPPAVRQTAPPQPVAQPVQTTETDAQEPVVESTSEAFGPPASPTIRKLARDLGIDLRQVRGSQHGGRIVMEDLRRYIQGLMRAAQAAGAPVAARSPATPVAAPPSVDFSQWGAVSRKPFSPLRQVIARRMQESVTTIPQVTQFDEADITALLELRKKFEPAYAQKGARLTLTCFALRVVADALKQFPIFNASLDTAAQEIVFKEYIHISVAVDTEAGLMAPVIRDVDRKSLLELALELALLASKARERKLAPAELEGGSFTISNQGGIGGGFFTPIVNPPQAAILGLGQGSRKAVVRPDGAIEPRILMPMGLSYDHRLIDGASAARFIVALRQGFENFPEELIKIGA